VSTIDQAGPANAAKNPVGLRGLAFAELCGSEPELRALLGALGFSHTRRHASRALDVYTQGSATFLVNDEPDTHAAEFRAAHGPCVSALGFAVDDPAQAFSEARARGARPYTGRAARAIDAPAVHGVGDSLIYFVAAGRESAVMRECPAVERPTLVPDRGLLCFDHLTNNVAKGELATWAKFYEEVFGFTHVRSFDIKGNKTGLYSFALRSPDGSFCIPINEDKGGTGQIAEYLKEYRGAGIQHIALLSNDLLSTLDRIDGAVPTLDIDDSYYENAFARVPGVRENPERIRAHNVLIDGDPEGYLLQIFTKNCVGPIFFELIQRENHLSFGEGNFGALFRSIERDQERRGVI
jgi:4-hydroxyphenylpyruvate dioxygenase